MSEPVAEQTLEAPPADVFLGSRTLSPRRHKGGFQWVVPTPFADLKCGLHGIRF